MSQEHVLLDILDQTSIVTISRQESRNGLIVGTCSELLAKLEMVAAD